MGSIGIASPTTIDPHPFGLDSSALHTREHRIAELVKKLSETWAHPSAEDKTHFQLYMGLARGILETAHHEFQAQIEAYKHLLKKDNTDDIFTIIFLLRRKAHQESFYGVIDIWSKLAFHTQDKIFAHLHDTYTFIATGSTTQNHEFATLLSQRHSDTKNVLENLPMPFKKITELLDEKETELYLHALEHAVINTVAVRKLLEVAEIL